MTKTNVFQCCSNRPWRRPRVPATLWRMVFTIENKYLTHRLMYKYSRFAVDWEFAYIVLLS